MKITGLWEALEESGSKPQVVNDCEVIEYQIEENRKALQVLRHKQYLAYRIAIRTFEENWTQGEIRKAKEKHSIF